MIEIYTCYRVDVSYHFVRLMMAGDAISQAYLLLCSGGLGRRKNCENLSGDYYVRSVGLMFSLFYCDLCYRCVSCFGNLFHSLTFLRTCHLCI